MEKKERKKKEPTFSEEIDSMINGYALGACFIGVGVFLLLKPDYFHVPVISYIVGAVFSAFGVLGTGIELSKSAKFKGAGNISFGIVFIAIWLILYRNLQSVWANAISFLLLVIGSYAIFLGFFQGAYSLWNNIKAKKDSSKDQTEDKGEIVTQTILFLTQLCALAVGVLNIVKASSGS